MKLVYVFSVVQALEGEKKPHVFRIGKKCKKNQEKT